MKRIIIILFLSLCGSSELSAQVEAIISGVVTADDKATPVRGASITLLNTNLSLITDDKGTFAFSGLKPGTYAIHISSVGFADITRSISTGNSETFALSYADKQLDEVVVSAEKRDQPLQQVPSAITALSARDIKEYRLWSTKDITSIAPNVHITNSGGDEKNITFIRGIGTTSYDPAIATYVDGVNQFTLDSYISQLSDIQRIEILRGPQGTLYGRNAMGGVINIITKQPTDAISAFAEINVGNYNLKRYEAGVRLPIVKGKLYAGASFMRTTRDGYYTNTFNNTPFDNQQITSDNFYLRYKPSGQWNISLNLKHQWNRNDGAYSLAPDSATAFAEPYKLAQNAIGQMIDNTLFTSLAIQYAGKGFNFTSQTAYQSNLRYYKTPIDGDFSPLDAVSISINNEKPYNSVKTWTQEFRFSSPAGTASSFNWTAGSYLFTDYRPNKQATYYGADATIFGPGTPTNVSSISTSTGNNKGIAFFGELSYNITPKLIVTGGLRYDYENKELRVLGEFQPDGGEAIVIYPDTSAVVHYNAFSPKLNLTYKIDKTHQLYAVYSRGFRTGGLTPLSLSAIEEQPALYPYKPEYSNNFEVGSKNVFFGQKLQVNVAAFMSTVTDVQVPTLVLPDAITVTRNAGRLQSKGLEAELTVSPAKGLQVNYNFGYTDASYTNLKVSQGESNANLDGKKQIFTPSYTSMLALQYSIALDKKQAWHLVARGELSSLGRQYFDLNNNIRQDAYSLVNIRAGISAKYFELMFWARNLTGEKYIAYAYDFGAVHLGDPKTLGVTLGVRL